MIQQVTTGIPALDSLVALITAIAGIVIAVGSITHSLSLRPELKSHKEALQSAAAFLTDVGSHVKDSKQDIKTLAEVTYNMLPERAAQIVNAQNVRLVELEKKVEAANEQLSRIPGALDHI